MNNTKKKLLIAIILLMACMCIAVAVMGSAGVIQNGLLLSKLAIACIFIMVASMLLYYYRNTDKQTFVLFSGAFICGIIAAMWIV